MSASESKWRWWFARTHFVGCRYQFCFYIFDKDKNGFIAQDELKSLITLLYANGVVSNLKAGLYKFDTDKDGACIHDIIVCV